MDSYQALSRFNRLSTNSSLNITERTTLRGDPDAAAARAQAVERRREIMDECDALLRRYGAEWALELARLIGAEKQAQALNCSPKRQNVAPGCPRSDR